VLKFAKRVYVYRVYAFGLGTPNVWHNAQTPQKGPPSTSFIQRLLRLPRGLPLLIQFIFAGLGPMRPRACCMGRIAPQPAPRPCANAAFGC